MSDIFAERRRVRERFENADRVIHDADQRSRKQATERQPVPPIEPTEADLAVSATAAMTCSVEWMARLLLDAHHRGFASLHSAIEKSGLFAAWDEITRGDASEEMGTRLQEQFPALHAALDELMDHL